MLFSPSVLFHESVVSPGEAQNLLQELSNVVTSLSGCENAAFAA